MDISIVVPTRNSASTLPWTLLSLRSQEGCNVEIIVVDSGSTDRTLDVCEQYRVRVLQEPPGNIYRAINAGLKIASAPWMGYLNSDDIVYQRSYQRLLLAGVSQSVHVIYGSSDFIDTENRFLYSYQPGRPKELLSQFRGSQLSFVQPAAIFSSEVFHALEGFDEKYLLASDFDFFWRALLRGFKFLELPGPTVACFRISSGQLSQNRTEMLKEVAKIQNTYDPAKITDYLLIYRWRLRNLLHYFLRILRRYLLTNKLSLVRSHDLME